MQKISRHSVPWHTKKICMLVVMPPTFLDPCGRRFNVTLHIIMCKAGMLLDVKFTLEYTVSFVLGRPCLTYILPVTREDFDWGGLVNPLGVSLDKASGVHSRLDAWFGIQTKTKLCLALFRKFPLQLYWLEILTYSALLCWGSNQMP